MTTDPGRWRKSSYGGTNGDCVEIADLGGHAAVRNSNHPDAGTLTFTTSAMRAFVDACKPGQLDHLCERRLIAIPSTAK